MYIGYNFPLVKLMLSDCNMDHTFRQKLLFSSQKKKKTKVIVISDPDLEFISLCVIDNISIMETTLSSNRKRHVVHYICL